MFFGFCLDFFSVSPHCVLLFASLQCFSARLLLSLCLSDFFHSCFIINFHVLIMFTSADDFLLCLVFVCLCFVIVFAFTHSFTFLFVICQSDLHVQYVLYEHAFVLCQDVFFYNSLLWYLFWLMSFRIPCLNAFLVSQPVVLDFYFSIFYCYVGLKDYDLFYDLFFTHNY